MFDKRQLQLVRELALAGIRGPDTAPPVMRELLAIMEKAEEEGAKLTATEQEDAILARAAQITAARAEKAKPAAENAKPAAE